MTGIVEVRYHQIICNKSIATKKYLLHHFHPLLTIRKEPIWPSIINHFFFSFLGLFSSVTALFYRHIHLGRQRRFLKAKLVTRAPAKKKRSFTLILSCHAKREKNQRRRVLSSVMCCQPEWWDLVRTVSRVCVERSAVHVPVTVRAQNTVHRITCEEGGENKEREWSKSLSSSSSSSFLWW